MAAKTWDAPAKKEDQLAQGPGKMTIDFGKLEGSIKLETGETLASHPFSIHIDAEDGPMLTPENIGAGKTKNDFGGDGWMTDEDGKYLFESLDPEKTYHVKVISFELEAEGEGRPIADDGVRAELPEP